MTFQKFSRVFVCFLFVLARVASWTIDLPEVRRQVFEEHDQLKKYASNDYKNYISDGREFYNNIIGNRHNSDEGKIYTQYDQYANAFGYQSYMEKKVSDIVRNGGIYLEGLRRALEDYSRFLEQCKRQNMSVSEDSKPTWRPPVLPTQYNISAMSNVSNSQNYNVDGAMVTRGDDSTRASGGRMRTSCREATEAREKVRRYADLAMWATRRLQDLAYAGEYQESDQYEENELILKLAWFLDRLAVLTGYEPNHRQYMTRSSSTTSTTSPMPPTLVPSTQELNEFLMNCIKIDSSVPATVRCRYPLPLPGAMAQVDGVTSTQSPQPDGTNKARLSRDSQQSMELLIAAADSRTSRRILKRSPTPEDYLVPIPVHDKPKPVVDFIVKKLSNLKDIVKSVKKHAVADFTSQLAYHKHLHKRAIDDNTSGLPNRFLNHLTVKPIAKPDLQQNENNDGGPIDKPEQSDNKLDEIIAKSNESIVKSDESIVNKSKIDAVSLKIFPILDASVVNTKSFKKRSVRDSGNTNNLLNKLTFRKAPVTAVKSVKKRSVDDPLSKFTTYYFKHKVWDNSNPTLEPNKKASKNFEVNNSLPSKIITKRSLIHKKNIHLMFPHIIRSNKSKKNSKRGKSKLQFYLNKMLEKKHKKNKKRTHKRSLEYERMYLPRIPMNPVGDISSYVKGKRGRNYYPDLRQEALVRMGLQQAFETGNILVIHRFGSNYNPAVPDAFVAGVMKSLADS